MLFRSGGLVGAFALAGVLFERLGLRGAPIGTLLAAVVMQCFAFRAILSYYWGPAGSGLGGQMRALAAWSPWPSALVAALVGVLAATFVATCHAVVTQR